LKIDLTFLLKNLWECESFCARSIERTVMINYEICCLYVVLVLPGIVETGDTVRVKW